MFIWWLSFAGFLAASHSLERAWATVFVTPTCRVKGHSKAELSLGCGDGNTTGVVQHWHTPFRLLQRSEAHSKLDPVFMHHDGRLMVPNSSQLHSGLYYCLLQHTTMTTLWSYQLQIDPDPLRTYRQEGSCGGLRVRRAVGSEEEEPPVSQQQFVGAVAASVVLTFVVGFTAGALSRTYVLRCLRAVGKRLRTPHHRQPQPQDHCTAVHMTTLPPAHNQVDCQVSQLSDDMCSGTVSSTTAPPPAKPRRSFKRDDTLQATAYFESCEYNKEEQNTADRVDEEHQKCLLFGKKAPEGKSEMTENKMENNAVEWDSQGGREDSIGTANKETDISTDIDHAAEEKSRSSYSSGKMECDMDESNCNKEHEENVKMAENKRSQQIEEVTGVQETGDNGHGETGTLSSTEKSQAEDEESRKSQSDLSKSREEHDGNGKMTEKENIKQVEEIMRAEENKDHKEVESAEEESGSTFWIGEQENSQFDGCPEGHDGNGKTTVNKRSDEEEQKNENTEETKEIDNSTEKNHLEDLRPATTSQGSRIRVIRLYQYNEDGQRYCHLPDPSPNDPGPVPRLKQRSLSLTRLSAIMAAASAGPMDAPRENTEVEHTEGTNHTEND